jgi:Fe-S-cluster-containing dehydrogenase component
MSKYYLLQDQKKCIGCLSCEVHCKSNKGLPLGPRLGQIISVGPKMVANLPHQAFIFMPCFHCEDPWCVPVCPTHAMRKRPEDGIVYVEPALCVGCKSCITACPWGAPQWNPETGKVVKCDYCMDRVDQGLEPACVAKCVTHCLSFGRAEQMDLTKRERFARTVAFELETIVSGR